MRINKTVFKYKMKEVDYFGNKLLVPVIANFLAANMNGEVFWFSVKPFPFLCCWNVEHNNCHYGKAGNASFDLGEDWKDTLIEI